MTAMLLELRVVDSLGLQIRGLRNHVPSNPGPGGIALPCNRVACVNLAAHQFRAAQAYPPIVFCRSRFSQ